MRLEKEEDTWQYRQTMEVARLMKLWNLLIPHKKDRIQKRWCDIGSQGDHPKIDFTGMGMLGLTNLCFSKHPHKPHQILSH